MIVCPVVLWHPSSSIAKFAGLSQVRSFVNQIIAPFQVNHFNSELRRCLAFCGLDPRRYKSHSFRIGAACLAAEKGFSDAQIRALDRWKSDAFKLYIRNSTLPTF